VSASIPPRALVVEDERPARDYLATLIDRSGRARTIAAVGTAADARDAIERGLELEVAFVDLRLAGAESGMSLISWLRQQSPRTVTVITTASRAHALGAYDLGVADYLLKPLTKQRLASCFDRIEPHFATPREGPPRRVVARQRSALVFLELTEILAFEATGRLVAAHTTRGVFDVDLSLNALAESFGDALLRVHRSWLVRVAEIRRLERGGGESMLDVGADGLRVPVAGDRQADVRSALLARSVGLRER